MFDGRRAVAVDIERQGGGTERIEGGEIILAGGAINSPQLLQLSGVGRADDLAALGIPVVADLPGVGDHLQDHLEVYIQYRSLQPVSMQPSATQLWRRPFIGAQWLFFRSGPGATNHFEGGGFARSNDDVAYPNLMFHFLPLSIRYDGSAGTPGHGYQVHVGPMYSDARGSVSLKTTDPHDHPALRFNYLSTEQDRREWVEAVRVARHILNQPALGPFNGGETSPGPSVTTDDEIRDWVARDAETALHPSCTARMGVDGQSVLDPSTMRVHGLDGLRVVDASSMPYITNGNIYAPVMMLAEKAADLILGNTPLPAEHTPFYRHEPAAAAPVRARRRRASRSRRELTAVDVRDRRQRGSAVYAATVATDLEYTGLKARTWDALRGDTSGWDDRRFYLELIGELGQPVLDVGCGTGRLLLDFLAQGIDIDGVELSPEMVAMLRAKAAGAGIDLAGRVHQAAMETMDLGRRYRVVLVPSSSFQLLIEPAAAAAAMEPVPRLTSSRAERWSCPGSTSPRTIRAGPSSTTSGRRSCPTDR